MLVCHSFLSSEIRLSQQLDEKRQLLECSLTCHVYCYQTYNTNEELKKFYKVLSVNTDGNVEFVSTVEGTECLIQHYVTRFLAK